MRRSLRYMDAVKLLAGGENQLVRLLDEASAAMLLGAGVFDLFEAREQALRLLEKVLDRFGEKLRGVDRLTRTERIHAAHEVIRITAYFDALGEVMAEFEQAMKLLRFSASQQASVVVGSASGLGWRTLFQQVGQRGGGSPIQDSTSRRFFTDTSGVLDSYLRGLAFWDTLSETEQDRLGTLLKEQVPSKALERYQEHLRRLAADCPEFGVWVNLQAHAASREQIATGLADLEALLAPLAAGSPDRQQESVIRAHQAELARPIVAARGAEPHLAVPSLGEGYVDHDFRLAFTSLPTNQEWEGLELRRDLPTALSAFLLSDTAQITPLLILGQPGSGKSVLTRVLAARLPVEHFVPIRVELRRVDAEGDLQDHIESAIREQTGERVLWPRFATADPNLTPVVILDGFDELLQATGVAQTDFLLRIEKFQERERDQGRTVAVIVTSRTAVANRATLPDGIPIIRLEPFDDEHLARWIEIWNRANNAVFADRGVKPLSAATVLHHREIAKQPLLLLMLALYDATDNALTALDPQLSQTAVYERLLTDFAHRELTKDPDPTDLDRRVEHELLRLSIVAFAMFNRGAQWIDADSLTEDLRVLGIWETERTRNTFRSPISAGQQMVGRFFFIHDAKATRDGGELQTYEFLHASFNEYLIARLVVRLLAEIAAQHAAARDSVSRSINDTMLYALLSFECLAARAPIVEYTGELIRQQDPAIRAVMAEVVTMLFRNSLLERTDRTYSDYQPMVADVVQRASHWNVNLFLLMVLARDCVSMRELYTDKGPGAIYEWERLANMWRSCVSSEGWNGLIDSLAVERTWAAGERDIVVRVGQPGTPAAEPDLAWSANVPEPLPDDSQRFANSHQHIAQRANFLLDRHLDVSMHNTLPISGAMPNFGNSLWYTADGRIVTVTALLTAALMAPYASEHRHADDALADLANQPAEPTSYPADSAILELAKALSGLPSQADLNELFIFSALSLSIFITAVELDKVSAGTRTVLRDVALKTHNAWIGSRRIRLLYSRLDDLLSTTPAPPELEASPPPEPSPATSSPGTPATPPAVP